MTGINDLPPELVLDIIEHLKPHICPIGNEKFWREGGEILERWYEQGTIDGGDRDSESEEVELVLGKMKAYISENEIMILSLLADEISDSSDEKDTNDDNIENSDSKSDQGYTNLRSLRQ